MCKLKSGIILKDRVYIPDHDHHTQMLDELKIKDTRENAERLFVRAELYPKDGDIFSDPVTWIYRVDQDILPDWYVAEVDEARMREAVKAWYAAHVHIDKDGLTIDSGVHWIKGGKNICICDSATVECICGSATVKCIYGSATVKCICDSATVERICDSATVERICGSATVEDICDSATVERICDSATVKCIYDSATVERICDSATVEDIYDSATVECICGSATVKCIYGSATVKCICDSATVERICDSATVERICGSATVITDYDITWTNLDNAVVRDDATIKDCYNKRIIQAGEWTFETAEG